MSFNFPNSPTEGQEFIAIAGGLTYVYQTGTWKIKGDEAPVDGQSYGRRNRAWVVVPSTAGFVPEAPSNGQKYGRKDAGWSVVLYVGTSPPSSPSVNDLWVDIT